MEDTERFEGGALLAWLTEAARGISGCSCNLALPKGELEGKTLSGERVNPPMAEK